MNPWRFLGVVAFGTILIPGLWAQEKKSQTASKEEEGRYRSALLFANVIECEHQGGTHHPELRWSGKQNGLA